MSHAEALARAGQLRTALLDHGVKSVSIELVEGRPSSGWSDTRFVGSMGHHIVSHRGQGLTPGLRLVKEGRSDLPGPLCNGYGGFDEVARIICMAWANHPGRGGPATVEKGTVPANNGRPYFFGWEHEGGIRESDWTPSFRTFMGRCHAGTLDWLGVTERSHIEHKTWAPTRKVDRLGYTLTTARNEIKPHLEDDMALDRNTKVDNGDSRLADDVRRMRALGVFSEHTQPGGVAFNDEIAHFLDEFEKHIDRKISAAVRNAGSGGGLTADQVRAIINDAQIVAR